MKTCEKHLPTKIEFECEACPLCEIAKQWTTIARAGFELGLVYVQGALGCPLAIAAPQQEPYRTIGENVAKDMSAILAKMQKALQGDKKIIPAGLKLV